MNYLANSISNLNSVKKICIFATGIFGWFDVHSQLLGQVFRGCRCIGSLCCVYYCSGIRRSQPRDDELRECEAERWRRRNGRQTDEAEKAQRRVRELAYYEDEEEVDIPRRKYEDHDDVHQRRGYNHQRTDNSFKTIRRHDSEGAYDQTRMTLIFLAGGARVVKATQNLKGRVGVAPAIRRPPEDESERRPRSPSISRRRHYDYYRAPYFDDYYESDDLRSPSPSRSMTSASPELEAVPYLLAIALDHRHRHSSGRKTGMYPLLPIDLRGFGQNGFRRSLRSDPILVLHTVAAEKKQSRVCFQKRARRESLSEL